MILRRRSIQRMMLAFPRTQKTFHSRECSRFNLSFFHGIFTKLFSRPDKLLENDFFRCKNAPATRKYLSRERISKDRVLVPVSELKWTEDASMNLDWMWYGSNFSPSPLLFLPKMTRMWSKVHNSFPVRRECLALPVFRHFLVMSPV